MTRNPWSYSIAAWLISPTASSLPTRSEAPDPARHHCGNRVHIQVFVQDDPINNKTVTAYNHNRLDALNPCQTTQSFF